MIRTIAVVSLCALLIGSRVVAQDFPPDPCAEGTFVVHGEPLLPGSPVVQDIVTLHDGKISTASGCPPAPARFWQTPYGTFLRVHWAECGDLAKMVRLRARITPSCRKMFGAIASARPPFKRFFRAAQCNDPAACLRRCESNADCHPGAYCAKDHCDATAGRCQPQPDACPTFYDPVCGCDGITYGNACEAAHAGVNVWHSGPCETRCDVVTPCPDGQFCEMPPGICASGLDAGVCVDVPEACPDIYDPVCGCDGNTYGNDCERRAAKVQKSRDGACEECATACDCESRPFQHECPLLCPSCGSYWTCMAAQCIEQCGPLPGPCEER